MKKNRFFIRGETRVCDGIKQHSAVDLRYVQARSRTNWWIEAGKDKIVKQWNNWLKHRHVIETIMFKDFDNEALYQRARRCSMRWTYVRKKDYWNNSLVTKSISFSGGKQKKKNREWRTKCLNGNAKTQQWRLRNKRSSAHKRTSEDRLQVRIVDAKLKYMPGFCS